MIEPINKYEPLNTYQCPHCYRVVYEPVVSSYSIDTTCKCQMPKFMVIMEQVFPESRIKVFNDQ